jgi:hypothetical protein
MYKKMSKTFRIETETSSLLGPNKTPPEDENGIQSPTRDVLNERQDDERKRQIS